MSRGNAPGGGGECAPATSLLTEDLVAVAGSSGELAGTEHHVVVVVPDGYTEVTLGRLTEPVADNVAVSWDYQADVRALARSTEGIVLTGDGRRTVTIPAP